MNKLLKYKLSSILVLIGLISSLNVFSMEMPIEKTIKVTTSDGQAIELSEDVWKVIPMLSNLIGDVGISDKPIPLMAVNFKSMNLIVDVIQEVKNKVKQHFPTYKIESGFLTKFPWTVKSVSNSKVGDMLGFRTAVKYLGIDGIINALDGYGYSVADTIISGDTRGTEMGVLTLYYFVPITDLFGITYYKNADKLERLKVYKANLTNIDAGVFQGLNNLNELILSENQLSSISVGAFQGLNNLERLSLSDNQLTNIPVGAFQGLANLKSVFLDGNPLSQDNLDELKQAYPNVNFVFSK